MPEVVVPPFAPAMLNSLRAIGYSFEAALADIIDNSITADAGRIDIQFRTEPEPYLAVVDDGRGITPDRLLETMRHGGVGPDAARNAGDLGRFGLGMKTASLSQCRQLTVVSFNATGWCGARWDLDEVERRGDWVLSLLTESECRGTPHANALLRSGHGVIVLWRVFDRALAGETAPERALGELVDKARDHLSLAFHRFLAGEPEHPAIGISINNQPVRPADPYLSTHRAVRRLPPESLPVEGARVEFEAFILPHASRLTPEETALAGGEEGLRRNQGFYVYRERRLITYGTWFRLARQEELTKLARVRVDIPNSLDHLWALDIKKSSASPPEAVRAGLRRVVERIADTSRQVYRFRGRRTSVGPITHAWDRVVGRGGVSYAVNREHPAVASVRDALDERDHDRLTVLLRTLEMSLPADALYADMASERRVQPQESDEEVEGILRDLASRLLAAAGPDRSARGGLLAALPFLEPFNTHPALTGRIVESFRNAQ